MSVSVPPLPRRLKIGSTLVFLAGLVPLTVASILYVRFWIRLCHPDQPWLAGEFPFGPSPYSLNDIRACAPPEIAVDFLLDGLIEFTNVVNGAFLVLMLAAFGLRRFQKWAWYALLVVFLWVGFNDTLALLTAKQFPIPILVELTGLVGLFIARPAIFQRSDT